MKIQRTTGLMVVSAIALAGVVYLGLEQEREEAAQPAGEQPAVFAFAESDVEALEVDGPYETVRFTRADADSEWQMRAPEESVASDPAIAFLLDLLGQEGAEEAFTVPADELATYGLDDPAATITVQLDSGEARVLQLGDRSFDEAGVYALSDPPETAETYNVLLIPIEFWYAVDRQLAAWQALPEPPEVPEVAPEAQPDPPNSTEPAPLPDPPVPPGSPEPLTPAE